MSLLATVIQERRGYGALPDHSGRLSCLRAGISSRFLPAASPAHGRRAAAGGVRHDDIVDVAALGGDERREETVLVFLGAGGDLAGITNVGAKK